MKDHLKKIRLNMLFIVLFLIFMGIFSFYRSVIAGWAVELLVDTHDISFAKVRKGDGEPGAAALKIITLKKYNSITNKNKVAQSKAASKKISDIYKYPVTANLPKTQTPLILFREYLPEWSDPELSLFTPLRKYDGTVWRKEKTEIKGSTDGKILHLLCRFYDKDLDAVVTENTTGNKNNPWKDDSIEVFLMKDAKSTFYCQYVLSITGKGDVHYCKSGTRPNQGIKQKLPDGFVKPRYVADEFDGGFELGISIALSNIGIKSLKPGDSFLIQIVRNYHGQGYKNSVLLHLFPAYIYADKRIPGNNHDRRAFQKALVKNK
ncbi:MAG: hypothetical protein WC082_03780 [Victivallales bacterium]